MLMANFVDRIKDCVFPFRYKGKKYLTCTTFDSANGKAWCATKVDSNRNVITGKWGDCQQGCFQNDNCRTEKGLTCKFPFKFRGKNYDKCTTDFSANRKAWCATEVNSNGEVIDGQWDDCQSTCQGSSKSGKSSIYLYRIFPKSSSASILNLTFELGLNSSMGFN